MTAKELGNNGPYHNTYIDVLGTTGSQAFINFTSGEILNTEKFTTDTYAYTDIEGNNQQYQVNYSSFTLITTFGCTSVGEFPSTAVTLPTSVSVPGQEAIHCRMRFHTARQRLTLLDGSPKSPIRLEVRRRMLTPARTGTEVLAESTANTMLSHN